MKGIFSHTRRRRREKNPRRAWKELEKRSKVVAGGISIILNAVEGRAYPQKRSFL